MFKKPSPLAPLRSWKNVDHPSHKMETRRIERPTLDIDVTATFSGIILTSLFTALKQYYYNTLIIRVNKEKKNRGFVESSNYKIFEKTECSNMCYASNNIDISIPLFMKVNTWWFSYLRRSSTYYTCTLFVFVTESKPIILPILLSE
ncbi:uncharacterized protein EV154DRAFT_548654 [Mucor mucedo]|uniref:uncharacterized protein n=1 Tax=Mucor mucedo TaxID=29922 RepID=UPI00221F0DD6|nr:uncharacterized protein EV154DRAFT_548654 [Mucor mucedo]KAI7895091.1 hypothetical protein EV154DRAFT_548654 [Mucor mucedo]